jgi:predicted  nucleic acid-binding Zn-ribbon protein
MSSTNSKAAAEVERLLHEVRARIEAKSKEVRNVSAAVMALRLKKAELFKDLAKLRLDALAGERAGEGLERAERQATAILRERDQAQAALERKIAEATAREESLAEERVAAVGRIEAITTEISELKVRVEAGLAYDPAYQAQAEQAQEAEVMATRAVRKAEQAAKDRVEKGKPYEADPFFMYLMAARIRHQGLLGLAGLSLFRQQGGPALRLRRRPRRLRGTPGPAGAAE